MSLVQTGIFLYAGFIRSNQRKADETAVKVIDHYVDDVLKVYEVK